MKNQKGINSIILTLIIVAILMLLVISNPSYPDTSGRPVSGNNAYEYLSKYKLNSDYKTNLLPKDSLELVSDLTMTSSDSFGYYTYYIEGILKNVSGKRLDYAQVAFVIYDMAGNNIGSAFDNVNYIESNGTWKFKAMYFGQEQAIKYDPTPKITSW